MIDTLLCDIDGTLLHRGAALPGAAAALRAARDAGLGIRLLTNITAKTPHELATQLGTEGIEVEADEIQTATTACISFLLANPGKRCHLIVPDGVRAAFEPVEIDDVHPDFVVIGDIGDGFDYATLNRAFRMLRGGARLVALQKNLFWLDAEGERLDCGAFVIGLEAAAGIRAIVTGKPSPVFFEAALRQLGASAQGAVVIGDDIATDMAGARAIGAHALHVRTGKHRPEWLEQHRESIDSVLDSIADLPSWLDRVRVRSA
ncbi:TIGR01458 family HAD-type hydrolase [Burkholderia catarinensis]|uniref:TIGR01458 family HAD-type hydrolase n=1 Tax=Burkholderia catarinensis TaxID=1108140 RepID=UPI0009184A12|nr:TIGR01458 family HAD-type hydrolase [Burkholderia catarinensis]KAG8148783.1 HAD family hydrolase [Burkholderia catarinensis]